MKISAAIKGCVQVGEYEYQNILKTYLFDSSTSIDNILKVTGEKDISQCNLAPVEEVKR